MTLNQTRGIQFVEIGVSALDRSIDFYTGLLGFELADASGLPAGQKTQQGTQWLSAGTGLIKLREIGAGGRLSPGQDADRGRGFKHVGFKVGDVRHRAAPLHAASVRFTIEPVDALGEVAVAFFADPDGTLLEFVDRHVRYTTVLSGELAERERHDAEQRPADADPVFDHVAVAVDSLDRSLVLAENSIRAGRRWYWLIQYGLAPEAA